MSEQALRDFDKWWNLNKDRGLEYRGVKAARDAWMASRVDLEAQNEELKAMLRKIRHDPMLVLRVQQVWEIDELLGPTAPLQS